MNESLFALTPEIMNLASVISQRVGDPEDSGVYGRQVKLRRANCVVCGPTTEIQEALQQLPQGRVTDIYSDICTVYLCPVALEFPEAIDVLLERIDEITDLQDQKLSGMSIEASKKFFETPLLNDQGGKKDRKYMIHPHPSVIGAEPGGSGRVLHDKEACLLSPISTVKSSSCVVPETNIQ